MFRLRPCIFSFTFSNLFLKWRSLFPIVFADMENMKQVKIDQEASGSRIKWKIQDEIGN